MSDIYPQPDLSQNGLMGLSFNRSSGIATARCVRGGTAFMLYEFALSCSLLSAPAVAQKVQHVDVVGTVAARCSGGQSVPIAIKDISGADDGIRRSITVRCSGNTPALSVRAALDKNGVTLTAVGTGGRTGSAAANSGEGITSTTLGERLASSEGNLTVRISEVDPSDDAVAGPEEDGSVEIIVSPEI